MGSHVLQPSARRLLALLAILMAAMISACGLGSDRERAVGQSNEAIESVDRAGQRIAEAIATLSQRDAAARDLSTVRSAAEAYLTEVEGLNSAIRALGETSPTLQTHVNSEFRPKAESAAADCQRAIELLGATATDDDVRSAITLLGRCIDSYASAVRGVSEAYALLSE